MIRSQWNKPGQKLNIGFLRADSRLVVDLEECQIAEPALNEQIRHVRAHPPPKGGLKVVVRIAPEGWEVRAILFFRTIFPAAETGGRSCANACAPAARASWWTRIAASAFSASRTGDLVESFVGVEIDHQAIKAAGRNAAARGRTNGEFIEGRAEELLPGILERFDAGATAILIDPPRTGCPLPGLESLRRNRPAQVLYVSCHPATLARDLNILCAEGVFELKNVTPLDMFPQTQHVECVADLRRGVSAETSDVMCKRNELSENIPSVSPGAYFVPHTAHRVSGLANPMTIVSTRRTQPTWSDQRSAPFTIDSVPACLNACRSRMIAA